MSQNQSVDLDELLGFREARERADNYSASDENLSGFVKHRVFLNQVDTFHAKYISSYLTDQVYGASRLPVGRDEMMGEGGMGEGLGIGEELETESKEKAHKSLVLQNKYEVVGTLEYSIHNKSEDILFTLDENNQEEFLAEILKCGYIIYDITKNESEIPKALATLAAIEREIEKIKDMGPKTFKLYSEVRVFILISTVMTWALTKPIDPEEPDLAFTEGDYKKRKPHPNYAKHIACEREVTLKGRKYKDKLKTYVICSGITYGGEEEDLTFLFKLAWYNEKYLPIFQPGKNVVPLIHVRDLIKIIHGVCEMVPTKQFILAVEQTPCTLKQIVKSLSKTMGSGKTKEVTLEEAFLYSDVTQKVFERCTVNLNMEPGYITEELELEWQSESNLAENMNKIAAEFRTERNLTPTRIIIHGPPAVGKTRLAQKLCEYYGCHYVSVKTMLEETISELRENIELEKSRLKAKEEKQAADEELGEEEEGEGEAEEEEGGIEEWQEQLRDIENKIVESETGRLPDDYIVRLMKKMLTSNICQNQGYVLDGYPKIIAQAKELFGQASEAEGEEEEADEDAPAATGNSILPDYVIALQAADDFLCKRVMQLPERELEGTHYTEEHMLRRLAEFRTINTEDTTVLNFFDEIEIHPIVIDVMEYPSESMQEIFDKLVERIGIYKGFGLTAEEEMELMRIEENRRKLAEEEARLQRELLEKQAAEEHNIKMEEWTQLLENLQIEEEKLLAVQCEPLRQYLMKFVIPTLAKGLMEIARIKPYDPVDYLAEYLFRENPEGKMFDPSYTRDGEQLVKDLEENVKGLIEKAIENMDEKCISECK